MGTVKGSNNTWSNINLCHTNDFGHKNDKIAKWLDYRGGSCTRSITSHTTHLVCSEAAWKAKHPLVKAALENAEIQIVTFDWLEDSLMSKSKRPKRIVNKYRWGVVEKAEKRKSDQRKMNRIKKVDDKVKLFANQRHDILKDIEVDNYHVFNDYTGFDYTVTLSKHSISLNHVAWQHLKLCESNASPPAYFVYVKRSPIEPSTKPQSMTLTTVGIPFESAMKTFRAYFRKCTGIEWEARLDKNLPDRVDEGEKGEMWVYKPPESRETVGLLPPGKEHLQPKRKKGLEAEGQTERGKKRAKKGLGVEKPQPQKMARRERGVSGEETDGAEVRSMTGKVWMGSWCGGPQSRGAEGTKRNVQLAQVIEID